MRIPIYRKGTQIGPSGPIVLIVEAKNDIQNFSLELVYRISSQKLKDTKDGKAEYVVTIMKTGEIKLSTDIMTALKQFKNLVTTTEVVYYDVPTHIAMIPVLVALGILMTGIWIGRRR